MPDRQKLLPWGFIAMRLALGVIFLWFGLLKFSSHSPINDLLEATFPFFTEGMGKYALAIFETAIGAGLILNIMTQAVLIALIFHLLGTFSVFVIAPEIMFDPYFPFLTLNGEFVIKNLALAIGGLMIIWSNPPYARTSQKT